MRSLNTSDFDRRARHQAGLNLFLVVFLSSAGLVTVWILVLFFTAKTWHFDVSLFSLRLGAEIAAYLVPVILISYFIGRWCKAFHAWGARVLIKKIMTEKNP
jgi:hypothetical protein